MADCKSPFVPIPPGFQTLTYDMCYNIFTTTTFSPIYTEPLSKVVYGPMIKIAKKRICKKILGINICQSYQEPYIGTILYGTIRVPTFQATPTFDVTANGQMTATITTGTIIETTTDGKSIKGSVLYTGNLKLNTFILDLSVKSRGDNYFFKNYGFDLNLTLNFSSQFQPTPPSNENNSNNPTLFPGMSANVPRTVLEPITIYDVIPNQGLADSLVFLNLTVEPVITGGLVTTNWIFCSKNNIITLGGVGTMTLNIEAPAYLKPKKLGVNRVDITTFRYNITQNFQIPATSLNVVQYKP